MYALTKNSWENPFGETLGKVRPALSLSLSLSKREKREERDPPSSLSLSPANARASWRQPRHGYKASGTVPSWASGPADPPAQVTAPEMAALGLNAAAVLVGLGRIVALYYRSSTLYQIHEENRRLYF